MQIYPVHHCLPPPAWAAWRAAARGGRPGGFSLVELMVAVSIVAILLAMGVPAMQNFLTSRAVVSQADELAATLRLARSDALRLNSAVTVCAAADTTVANPNCAAQAANSPWSKGWITFVDLDNDGDLESGEKSLRVQSPLKSVKAVTSNTQGRVRFFPNGLPATGAAQFVVQPTLASTDSAYNGALRTVQVNTTGRALVKVGPASP